METACNTLDELLLHIPKTKTIMDNAVIAWSKINSPLYKNIICSISGGSDSDIMLDIVFKCDRDKKVKYVWFDTGLEYTATKNHLLYLNDKYNINIESYKAKKPIPVTCNTSGQPFLSKYVSNMIYRLQFNGFKWEDKSFEELYKEYPTCRGALTWWCNGKDTTGFRTSMFNIDYHHGLKEFLIANPPQFNISDKCCRYAKKDVAHKVIRYYKADLSIVGIRKSEGGIRAAAYKSCFDTFEGSADVYRPLFWYREPDKSDYENFCHILHSDCYSKYGLLRTGCAGCPFGKDFEFELEVIKMHEPKLYLAVNNIFGDSYDYTRKYRQFVRDFRIEERGIKKLF